MRLRSEDHKSRRHDLDEDWGGSYIGLKHWIARIYCKETHLFSPVWRKTLYRECLASKCFSHVVFYLFRNIGVKVPRFCGEDSGPYEGASLSRGGGLIFKLESCYRRDVDRSVLSA